MSVLRKSPLDFNLPARETETRHGWEVVTDYGLHPGPFLIDLSHCPKWDLQNADPASFNPWGLAVPDSPGLCEFQNSILINRMNRTQCAIWHLGTQACEAPPEESYTETTDGLCLLAVTGPKTLSIMDKVTSLDLGSPGLEPPCLIQGPILNIPCQVVLFSRQGDEATVIFSFSRGYGQSLAEAVLQAGRESGLKPGGEKMLNF